MVCKFLLTTNNCCLCWFLMRILVVGTWSVITNGYKFLWTVIRSSNLQNQELYTLSVSPSTCSSMHFVWLMAGDILWESHYGKVVLHGYWPVVVLDLCSEKVNFEAMVPLFLLWYYSQFLALKKCIWTNYEYDTTQFIPFLLEDL